MKKQLLQIGVLAGLLTSQASADFLGFEVGAGYWNAQSSGNFQKGNTAIDLENDLGYGGSNGTNTFYALFEHPIPLIPNVKVQQTDLSDSSNGVVSRALNFNGNTFNANNAVQSSLTLNQTDFVAYYEILDNWVNLDIGINVKYVDGAIELKDATTYTKEDFSLYIPMGYVKGQFDLPFSGLSAEAELSYIGYNSNSFYDAKAGIQYETAIGLGAEIGYREIKLTIDDLDDFNSDIAFSGVYAAVFYHF